MKSSAAALLLLLVVSHDPARPRLVFRTVSAGASHTCGIASGGVAYCWGDNTAGELGTGDGLSHTRPAAVTGHLTFASLSAGDGFTCGITDSGVAYCWGRNPYGQLGSRTPQRSEAPLPVIAVGPGFLLVSAGRGRVRDRRRSRRILLGQQRGRSTRDGRHGTFHATAPRRRAAVVRFPERRMVPYVRGDPRGRRFLLGEQRCRPARQRDDGGEPCARRSCPHP